MTTRSNTVVAPARCLLSGNSRTWFVCLPLAVCTLLLALLLAASIQPAGAQTITSITTPHPRLWITPARLNRMKTDAAANTSRWQAVLSVANAASSDLTNPDDIVPLALVYQVTGNTAYAQKAIADTLANAVSSNTLTDDSNYNYRTVIPDVSAGLDWCYNQMTTAQRQQVATWLMDRADQIWPETNPSAAGEWGTWPSNNYYWGFMTTWDAAIAAYGDDTKTGSVSGSNRPLYHVNLGLKHWNNDVLPWANTWGTGGAFAESTNYDLLSVFRMALILDGHLSGTGQDLVNNGGTTFLHDSLLWGIYATVPTLDQFYPLGDQTRDSMPDNCDYNRQRAYVAMDDTSDTTLSQQAQGWLGTISPSTSSWSFTVAWEFLYDNPNAPTSDFTTLPTSYFAAGPGMLFNRSD